MSTRPRDSQREKLYRAEKFLRTGDVLMFGSVAEMQGYVDTLLGRAWFRRRWPEVSNLGIEVRDGRSRRRAYAQGHFEEGLNIRMPRWTRCEAQILHEVAHHCAETGKYGYDVASHGWEFTSTYLELVRLQMGAESAVALREAYREHRVRYKAPRRSRGLSEAEKEVLRARLQTARAAKARMGVSV